MNPAIAALPSHRQPKAENYLYAFEFRDGRTKIGVTWNPQGRAQALVTASKCQIVRAHAAPYAGRWRTRAEADALARARAIAPLQPGQTEWFYGLKFGAAVTLLNQISRRPVAGPCVAPSQTKEGRRASARARAERSQADALRRFGLLVSALAEGAPAVETAKA